MLPHGIMGNGITLVFIRSIMSIYLLDVLWFRSDRTELAQGILGITMHFSSPWFETVYPDTHQDLVKISRRDRDLIKNSEALDLNFETETRNFKICAFCRNFFKTCCHHFWLELFLNFWHFSEVFCLFLTCK